MSETQKKVDTVERQIEAKIAAGEGHIPHPVTAVERAAAMQQARSQAFDASVAMPGYEPRRYAPTGPTARVTF